MPGQKHILIIVENLPVPLDRRVWQEAQSLRDLGYRVSVICPKMRGFTKSRETIDNIEIYRHAISVEATGITGFILEYTTAILGEIWLAWHIWFKSRFDVIHICNPPDLLFIAAVPFRLFGVKIIYDVHDLCPEMFLAKFGNNRILLNAVKIAERLTLFCADVVIATNQSVRQRIKQRGKLKDEDVYVVRTSPTSMSTDWEPDDSLRCGRKHLVGYIGVMGSADGVDLLLDAIRIVVREKQRTDIQFLLMGKGPEQESLRELRDEYGLTEFVTMPGHVSEEYLGRALRTIDLGTASDPTNDYNDHCTMNKTLEYMMFGKPQVLFDTTEGRFSAGDSAIYIQNNSTDDFAEAICELLDNDAERERMGRIGRERLREISWEASSQALAKAYNRCLGLSDETLEQPAPKNRLTQETS